MGIVCVTLILISRNTTNLAVGFIPAVSGVTVYTSADAKSAVMGCG